MSPTNPTDRLASSPRLTAVLFVALVALGQAGTAAAGSCATGCAGP